MSDGIPRGKPIARRLLDILKSAEGRPVPLVQITEQIYSDRLDGGPLRATDVVRMSVSILRNLGVRIESVQGYRVLSRALPALSEQQQAIVDAIRESGGVGGRRAIAAKLGIGANQVSVVMTLLGKRGVRIEQSNGYRLASPCSPGLEYRVQQKLASPPRRTAPRASRQTSPSRPAQNAVAMQAFGVLYRAGGRIVTWAELHDALYGHRRDGGPDEGVAKAIRWLGSVGVDVRREHRYALPKSPRRAHVTRPSCLAVLDAIEKGHDELDAIVAATGMTRNATLTAISRCAEFGLEVESVQGYRLHWHSIDQIQQPEMRAA